MTVWRDATATAAELLAGLGPEVERVYLVGPRPGTGDVAGARAWATTAAPGWGHGEQGHYLDGPAPVFRFVTPAGRPLEIHRAAAWLGEGPYTAADAERAMGEVERVVAAAFAGGRLLSTPATTGRELLLRTLPARDWPVLCDEHQDLVRSTSGQGRIELVGRSCGCGACVGFAGDELAGVAEYDGRLMYAALCRNIGAGPVEQHDAVDLFEPHRRGRYRVTFTVPADWCHVGLLGVPLESGQGWHYPNRPGYTATVWCDGAELHVAARAGWAFRVLERLLYAEGDPLRGWADKLARLRGDSADPLVRAGVRQIVLTGIGALHGRGHRVTRVTPLEQSRAVPAGTRATRAGDALVWQEDTGQRWETMAHPEWSSAIWARARVRLLTGPHDVGALHVPAGDVIGFRTDAVYLARRYRFADDGKAGRLVAKSWRPGPVPAPKSHADLLRLRDEGTSIE